MTTDEVAKATTRVSPLAMSMAKPPDPELFKTMTFREQREYMAQHAASALLTSSSSSPPPRDDGARSDDDGGGSVKRMTSSRSEPTAAAAVHAAADDDDATSASPVRCEPMTTTAAAAAVVVMHAADVTSSKSEPTVHDDVTSSTTTTAPVEARTHADDVLDVVVSAGVADARDTNDALLPKGIVIVFCCFLHDFKIEFLLLIVTNTTYAHDFYSNKYE